MAGKLSTHCFAKATHPAIDDDSLQDKSTKDLGILAALFFSILSSLSVLVSYREPAETFLKST